MNQRKLPSRLPTSIRLTEVRRIKGRRLQLLKTRSFVEVAALILTGEYQPEKPRLDEIQSDGMREDDEIIDADFREVDDEEQEEVLDEFAIW